MYQLSITIINFLNKATCKEKVLFWLQVLEASVHHYLAPLFLGLWQRSIWQSKAISLTARKWKRGSNWGQSPRVLFKGISQCPKDFPLDPLLKASTSQFSHHREQAFTTWNVGGHLSLSYTCRALPFKGVISLKVSLKIIFIVRKLIDYIRFKLGAMTSSHCFFPRMYQ
jgi:hypothetical protein